MPAFRKHALSPVHMVTFQFFLAYFLQSAFSLPLSSVYISLAISCRRHGHACHFSAPPTSPGWLHSWPAELLKARWAHGGNPQVTLACAANLEQGLERPLGILMGLLRRACSLCLKQSTLKQDSSATSLWGGQGTPGRLQHFLPLAFSQWTSENSAWKFTISQFSLLFFLPPLLPSPHPV